jgi:ABC-type polysaccharide/polyol phosphate export permease
VVSSYGYLFDQLVRRELRQKYKGSALGVLWYVINPLVLMGAYALLFGQILKVQSIHDYPIFLIVGLVAWTFFAQSLISAAPSLLDQGGLIRKARFPREAIPASTVTVQLVTFCAVTGLLVPVAVAVRGTLTPALLLLPVLIALLYGFVLGLALIVAVLHVYYRDVAPILSAALLPWFFLTPIFFTLHDKHLSFITHHPFVVSVLNWFNPVAPFIEGLRAVLYDGTAPDLGRLAYMLAAAALSLILGRAIFRRLEGELAVVV